MREQLEQYVKLLFAGSKGEEDMQQEILQNTLDRYDDLIAQGKTPEAAYRLAISGIGDLSEVLSQGAAAPKAPAAPAPAVSKPRRKPYWKKMAKIGAIFLYIMSAIPLLTMGESGLVGTISIVAVATVAILVAGDDTPSDKTGEKSTQHKKEDPLQKAIGSIIGVGGLCVYFIISFWTGAWYITWLIFPIMGAVRGLVNAIFDLKGAEKNEN